MRMALQIMPRLLSAFFFFNDAATTEIYTLSLHDALPISCSSLSSASWSNAIPRFPRGGCNSRGDRKSTRLNSSHLGISYAVFCLKKKKAAADGTRQKHSLDSVLQAHQA